MNKVYRVAVLVDSAIGSGRGLCRGIGLFAQEHKDWLLSYTPMAPNRHWPIWFREWRGEGLLTAIENPQLLPLIKAKRVPFVDFKSRNYLNLAHTVATDHHAVSELAVEFFLNAGYKNFAFCGFSGVWHSDQRAVAFVERLQQRGLTCAVYRDTHTRSRYMSTSLVGEAYLRDQRRIVTWLKPLPKPLAVFASDDLRGLQVINACQRYGIHVPDAVAVLGVNNDEVICNLCTPPLSSIQPNYERMGYLATQRLDEQMRQRRTVSTIDALPPVGLVERASTDLIAVSDPVVAKLLRRIRGELASGLISKELIDESGLTRRALDARFVRHTGLTMHGVLLRERLRRAQLLLQEGRRTVAAVAHATGFHNSAQFIENFKRHFGVTPGLFQARKISARLFHKSP